MKSPTLIFLILVSMFLAGCSLRERPSEYASKAPQPTVESTENENYAQTSQLQDASLRKVDDSQAISEAMDRKVIKNAELKLEVASPNETQHKISEIAASVGGFVVDSETKHREGNDQSKPETEVKLVVRVPAAAFENVVNRIRSESAHLIHDNVSGQDVTEEFIDLEARIKTQKALEVQFLEIMKQAYKVADALEVQRQIAEVRSDIERLEGRKRFLQNRASLSTITVGLQTPTVIVVNTSSFGRSIKETVSTSIDMATGIVLLLVRLVILSIPVLLLIGLPVLLVTRYLMRRAKRHQLARELESLPATE